MLLNTVNKIHYVISHICKSLESVSYPQTQVNLISPTQLGNEFRVLIKCTVNKFICIKSICFLKHLIYLILQHSSFFIYLLVQRNAINLCKHDLELWEYTLQSERFITWLDMNINIMGIITRDRFIAVVVSELIWSHTLTFLLSHSYMEINSLNKNNACQILTNCMFRC